MDSLVVDSIPDLTYYIGQGEITIDTNVVNSFSECKSEITQTLTRNNGEPFAGVFTQDLEDFTFTIFTEDEDLDS